DEEVDGGTDVPVHGDHTYAAAGSYTVTVVAVDADENWGTAAVTATVTNPVPPLIVTSQNITATAGQSFSGSLGTVTDTTASSVLVTVHWGDGTTDSVAVGGGTAVPIDDTHTYAAAGVYTITLSASDGNGNTGSATDTADVSSATVSGLTVTANSITAIAGRLFTGTAGTLTDPAAPLVAVTVSWGDGTSTSEDVSGGTNVAIPARHTYASAGTYTVTVSASDGSGNTASGSGTATVVASPLTVTADDVTAMVGQRFSGAVGTLTDPAALIVAVTIQWGDGTSATEEVGGGSGVSIPGLHTYQRAGTYAITVSAKDGAGDMASATGSVQVNNPPLALTAITLCGLCVVAIQVMAAR
ncbi:MAG: PKD domain-containing protein, partial [Mycobacterium sp.]|nr:PKD domain-containing protein [Mycobacterium sp.]